MFGRSAGYLFWHSTPRKTHFARNSFGNAIQEFYQFQGSLNDPNEVLGSGDVKYHLGVSVTESLMVKVFIYH